MHPFPQVKRKPCWMLTKTIFAFAECELIALLDDDTGMEVIPVIRNFLF